MDRALVGALLLACVGLVVMITYARSVEAKPVGIEEIGEGMLGRYVEVEGTVSSVSSSNGNVFIKLCRSGCVKIVIFASVAGEMGDPNPYILKKGDRLVVRGEVDEYRGELEVVVFRKNDLEMG